MLFFTEAAVAVDSLADVFYREHTVVITELLRGTDGMWTAHAVGGETGAHDFGRIDIRNLNPSRNLREVIAHRLVFPDSDAPDSEGLRDIVRAAMAPKDEASV